MESGFARSNGGKRASLLRLNDQARWAIGCTIDADRLSLAAVDLTGALQARIAVPLEAPSDRGAVREALHRALSTLRPEAGAHAATGIGVALPHDLTADGPALLREITRDLNIPRSARTSRRARRWAAWAATASGLCATVHMEAGIGLSILQDGRPLQPGPGNSATLDHVGIDPSGPPCECGGHGCLHQYASARARGPAAARDGWPRLERLTPSSLSSDVVLLALAAAHGEPRAREIFTAAAAAVAQAVWAATSALGIRTVVLSGPALQAAPVLVGEVMAEHYTARARNLGTEATVTVSQVQPHPCAVGAAVLALQTFVSPGLASRGGSTSQGGRTAQGGLAAQGGFAAQSFAAQSGLAVQGDLTAQCGVASQRREAQGGRAARPARRTPDPPPRGGARLPGAEPRGGRNGPSSPYRNGHRYLMAVTPTTCQPSPLTAAPSEGALLGAALLNLTLVACAARAARTGGLRPPTSSASSSRQLLRSTPRLTTRPARAGHPSRCPRSRPRPPPGGADDGRPALVGPDSARTTVLGDRHHGRLAGRELDDRGAEDERAGTAADSRWALGTTACGDPDDRLIACKQETADGAVRERPAREDGRASRTPRSSHRPPPRRIAAADGHPRRRHHLHPVPRDDLDHHEGRQSWLHGENSALLLDLATASTYLDPHGPIWTADLGVGGAAPTEMEVREIIYAGTPQDVEAQGFRAG